MHGTVIGGNGKADERWNLDAQTHRRPGATAANREEQLQNIFSHASRFFEAQGVGHMQAEDIALETCLRWLAQVKRERPAGFSWLLMVQRNLLIDHRRWCGREQRLLESYAESHLACPEEAIRSAQNPLADSWEKLPASDQEILLLHYVEGRPIRELAERLEVSSDCAKQRLCRSRKRLSQLCHGILSSS